MKRSGRLTPSEIEKVSGTDDVVEYVNSLPAFKNMLEKGIGCLPDTDQLILSEDSGYIYRPNKNQLQQILTKNRKMSNYIAYLSINAKNN